MPDKCVCLQGRKPYLDVISEYVKLYFTMPASTDGHLPKNSYNYGVVNSSAYQSIARTSKVSIIIFSKKIYTTMIDLDCLLIFYLSQLFIGLGDPVEGPGAMEALARGCIFINPQFRGERQKLLFGKPTRRLVCTCFANVFSIFSYNLHLITNDKFKTLKQHFCFILDQ